MFVGESESLLGKLVFTRQRGAEHGWIVAVERDHHAVVEITLRRMIIEVRAEAGAQIAGQADFNRNLPLRKLFHQIRIMKGSEAVPDALDAQVECSPDRFRRASFAGMCGKPHAMVGSPRVGIAKKFRRSFLLVPANANSN